MTVPMMNRERTDTEKEKRVWLYYITPIYYKPVTMTGTLMSGADSSEYGGVSVGVVESRVGIVMMPVGVQCEPPGMEGNE